ncbi:hypothetical protein THAOC_30161, partial [Thalassiosira oceanica]
DPHRGNMMRTTDGKLAILDFGLMTEVTDNQKYGAFGSECPCLLDVSQMSGRMAHYYSTVTTSAATSRSTVVIGCSCGVMFDIDRL